MMTINLLFVQSPSWVKRTMLKKLVKWHSKYGFLFMLPFTGLLMLGLGSVVVNTHMWLSIITMLTVLYFVIRITYLYKTAPAETVQITMSDEVKELLEKLKNDTGAYDISVVLQRSVALYNLMILLNKNGTDLVLRDSQGNERIFKFK